MTLPIEHRPIDALRISNPDRQLARSPLVVGIGASAGGIPSIIELLSRLSVDGGLAYVLIQHLDPHYESILAEILDRASDITAVAAVDGVRMAADTLYVIPPSTRMTVTDGHLRVVHSVRPRGVRTEIDGFLESLAAVHGADAVGVILSGSGSDGTDGISAIKEHGGITIAQDPLTAQYTSMPEHAIATGCVDFVLSPEGIAAQLAIIGHQRSINEL